MDGKVREKIPLNDDKNIVNNQDEFSMPELKLLNLIAEIIVNISIRESHEESNKISSFQRQEAK
ncbi:hypothetical protein SAMN05444410_101312 [Hydrobacter penzbergensis]|uniref:Uncharacterized protein n=2 Tax=Hydrobacter penzbergensis TaxID=1235997 RepID=A0A8X8L9V5_9BACT|nr:hypothetical protein SAMN05444410_101312 [Hydrobacter penzbergensis]